LRCKFHQRERKHNNKSEPTSKAYKFSDNYHQFWPIFHFVLSSASAEIVPGIKVSTFRLHTNNIDNKKHSTKSITNANTHQRHSKKFNFVNKILAAFFFVYSCRRRGRDRNGTKEERKVYCYCCLCLIINIFPLKYITRGQKIVHITASLRESLLGNHKKLLCVSSRRGRKACKFSTPSSRILEIFQSLQRLLPT
jgi:hypothetical protein